MPLHSTISSNTIKTPPRTTSLRFRQMIMNSPPSSPLSMFDDGFEQIDLNSTCTDEVGCSLHSTTSSSSSSSSITECCGDDLTLENMSNVIAAAIELSMSNHKRLSSLSAGNASIKYTKKSTKKRENRFSKHLFRWSTNPTTSTTTTPILPKPMRVYDDGKQEPLYRGIRVQEVPTTFDPMIIPLDFHPNSSLQRPQFARISY
ncbi:Mitochondrial oxaloacetate carrier protein [Mucor velutinosus]|uniref:Mitochondrial oxaloacetate carrier protein n=1 Tax=Mucor velutinosus TaxID=708070 RepID=A0AAN7D5P2_9FUNG|nr:Mitochondrial oxaloacetate carrier protein [Mucor velutinosus]